MLNVSSFVYTADIYTIIHFIPHACQHITVDQSHGCGDTADLTLCDFFLWGFGKNIVFVPPLPANLQDHRNRITVAVVALVDL
jgi:hypothetical protein